MDSFFVSVEERDNSFLQGKPVAVGGLEENRGVISTANYLARKYGVHSAISSAKAKQLCPNLIIIRPNIDKYKQISSIIQKHLSKMQD